MIAGRTASRRGFSIVEALVAFGLVVLALAGVFEVMPYTYRTLQEDSLRAEAATAAQRYLEGVRLAVQTGSPFPSPTVAPLVLGESLVTGQAIAGDAQADLTASCTQPDGPGSSLFDCRVDVALDLAGERRPLPPLETIVTRQLP